MRSDAALLAAQTHALSCNENADKWAGEVFGQGYAHEACHNW